MSKLTIALGTLMGASGKQDYCPDCGMAMKSNGTCPECGYGEDDGDMEEEDEQMETQTLLDTKKALQSAMDLIDRLIVNNCD
jgi:tRNA(Ile2) C34 agmatinyltransferase TiaS